MTRLDRSEIERWFQSFQARFTEALQDIEEQAELIVDLWERPDGGGGETRILSGPGAIEKAAVNFSAVHGPTPPRLSESLAAKSTEFAATGVSIIVHPANPFAPAFHANVRFFETDAGHAWFAGGADLTPNYLFEEDARHFHGHLRAVCDRHDVADYHSWKAACDSYFYLEHRHERRGVGGVFFDHLQDELAGVWAFQQDFAESLRDAYVPILEERKDTPFAPNHRRWQLIRRGRYAEFNLVWDRGTRFGLETGGRTESILASLPPAVVWEYGAEPDPDSPEARLLAEVSGPPRSWVS